MSTALSGMLNQNMNMTEVFSSIGKAAAGEKSVKDTMDSVYQAVFHPQEDESVAVSKTAAGTEYQVPDQAAGLKAFSTGTGTCVSWMNLAEPETAQSAQKAQDGSNAAETAGAVTQKTDETAAAQNPDAAETMQLSSVLYSGESLPANVNLEQVVLGFAYCTPVSGTLSSAFGYREHPVEGEEKFHYGIDLAADTGTEIDCFANGTVTAVGESSSYGKYVIVSHKNDCSTLYAHCSAISVASGTAVKKGEKIAEVGETGIATGPHLHFEVHSGDGYLNPIYYVSAA